MLNLFYFVPDKQQQPSNNRDYNGVGNNYNNQPQRPIGGQRCLFQEEEETKNLSWRVIDYYIFHFIYMLATFHSKYFSIMLSQSTTVCF